MRPAVSHQDRLGGHKRKVFQSVLSEAGILTALPTNIYQSAEKGDDRPRKHFIRP